jgi:hypothetical protein
LPSQQSERLRVFGGRGIARPGSGQSLGRTDRVRRLKCRVLNDLRLWLTVGTEVGSVTTV